MITIVDYGVGNLGSIQNMLKKIGAKSVITSEKNQIEDAQKLILPGVGSFDSGMSKLQELDFVTLLNKKVVEQKTPILGICLGMQLMTKSSEEGTKKGLGWFDAETIKFNFDSEKSKKFKVPNMGWNYVYQKKNSSLFIEMFQDPKFYFVHSYYIKCNNQTDVLATSNYDFEYVCAFEKENIFGVQFHPEKSHKYGMRLLTNFSQVPC